MKERAQQAEQQAVKAESQLSALQQVLDVEKQRYVSTFEQLQKVEEEYKTAKQTYEAEKARALEADKAAAVEVTRLQTELQGEKQRLGDKQDSLNKLEEEMKGVKKANNDLRQVSGGLKKKDEELGKLKEKLKELEDQLSSQKEKYEVCG